MSLRTAANAMTASRGVMGLVVALVLVEGSHRGLAFPLFLLGILTDLFDGALAKRAGGPTALGTWLDPIADKLLTNFTWAALWACGWAPAWLAASLVLRDLLTMVVFTTAWRRGHQFQANHHGKLAVTVEAIALCVLTFHGPWVDMDWPGIGVVLGGVCMALSATASMAYLRGLVRGARHVDVGYGAAR